MELKGASPHNSIPKERFNIEYVSFQDGKKIYVFLNHRVAYLCWIDSVKKGIIKNGALLVHVDHHADFSLSSTDLIDKQERIGIQQEKKLRRFVKNKLSVLNYEFIVLSMYRGIIGDAISIDVMHDNVFGDYKKMTYETTNRTEFVDNAGRTHTFYLGGSSINELVGYQGLLTDRYTHQDVQKVFNQNVRENNVILDIDLDFFTYQDNEGKTWAINERNLETTLNSEGFNYLFHNAAVVTIALEPFFCGNSTECLHILSGLNSWIEQKIGLKIKGRVIKKFQNELSKTY